MTTFSLATQHVNMFTFAQFDAAGKHIAHVRGFGSDEAEALADAKKEFSMHEQHFAAAPHSYKVRGF